MSNFVWHRLICHRNVTEELFSDSAFCIRCGSCELPGISFRRVYDLFHVDPETDLISGRDSYIANDQGISVHFVSEELCELMFLTRNFYPVFVIFKTLEMFHDTIWYAVEENCVYVSKFIWETDQLVEYAVYIEKEYGKWLESNFDYALSVQNPDSDVWHFMENGRMKWKPWDNRDPVETYSNFMADDVCRFFRRDFMVDEQFRKK